METGEAAVPPRATSGRRYKALTTWRFQRGFVRKQAKTPAAAPRGRGGAPVGGSGAKRSRSASVVGSGAARPAAPADRRARPPPLHLPPPPHRSAAPASPPSPPIARATAAPLLPLARKEKMVTLGGGRRGDATATLGGGRRGATATLGRRPERNGSGSGRLFSLLFPSVRESPRAWFGRVYSHARYARGSDVYRYTT
nr:zinc finger and BTB domain-containing protein 4-like [Aegilops tauschii subsp. strangulata]